MAPKSSNIEMKDGSSSDPELKEPIETSTGVASFAAREFEFPDAPLVEYQAKAAWSVTNKTYPMFCRPSPIHCVL
ncbi:unnamed protein product [Arabidopsis lyrata]|uniref:Uncharacterized protein n=1 Tax=Arabidopsis lyrata subsp. lyrata TaxID=81972 RepID=D7L3U7_ARALL|nr:hypothetical protein ARALYDRAFT_896626 [Arabidopsis lyrata subsp. lyrata]CAH8259445.1 unnamed protein product [Arabidopsis lyrata]